MKRRPLICIAFVLTISSCESEENIPEPSTEYEQSTIQYKQLDGVNANLLSLDVYHFESSTDTKPVVVYVHGGAWAIGDKANNLANKQSLFQSLGYVFVSVNYRLSPNPPELANPNRLKFPAHNEDVADAVAWVLDNIQKYGGDPNRIALMGHSAGAHLVSLTGTSPVFLPARGIPLNKIKGIISIDTEGYHIPTRMATTTGQPEQIYQNAFGTDPDVWEQASPISHLSSEVSYPKFFIAKRGSPTRLAMANSFIDKLQQVGVSIVQVEGSSYTHEGINDAIGKPNETIITEPLVRFLADCFQK